MEKIRTDEEVLKDAMDIFKEQEPVATNLEKELKDASESASTINQSQLMGEEREERHEQEKPVMQERPSKRRHMGELQRLKIANEQAKQVAFQKEQEARILKEEMEALKRYNDELIRHANDLKSSYADGILESTEQELAEAVETGDTSRIPAIMAKQREINKILAKQVAEETIKEHLPEYPPVYSNYYAPQYSDHYEANYNEVSQENPHYLAWLDKVDVEGNRINAWADPTDDINYSPELVNEALEYAGELNKLMKKKGQGHLIGTLEYYDIISSALDAKHGFEENDKNVKHHSAINNFESSRPTSYAPVHSGSSYIAPKQGSKYTLNPEISTFISKLSILNPNLTDKSDEEKYQTFMKFYDEENNKTQRR